MAYQFVHLEAFSRKGDGKGRSTSFVFNEARRDPAASVHVQNPARPVLVYGSTIDDVEAMHDAAADVATTTPRGGKPRRIQKTQHTLMTVVASHPHTMEEVRADPGKRREAEEWEKRTVGWLQSQYGDNMVSVVRHEDESHYHLHAYILPADQAMRASALHPGQCAKASVMASGPVEGEDSKALNKRGDAAYKAAMRGWQDAYHETVAIPCGLTRLGPQRRRLTRAEWQVEQVQAKALQSTLDRAQAVRSKIETHIVAKKAETESMVSTAETTAATLRAEANAAQAEAARELAAAKLATAAALAAQDKAVKEQEKARGMMARVRQEASRVQAAAARLQRLPGVLRSVWDGFRKSAIEARIRQATDSEMDGLRQQAVAADGRAMAAHDGRRQAEEQARNLRESLAETGRQLAVARREIGFLRRAEPEPTPGTSPPGLRKR